MKKIGVLLGLLVLALFVVSCAPKEAGEEGEEVVEEEKGALAGQAVSANYCTDSDGGEDYKVKGTVVSKQYPKGVTDICPSPGKLAEKYCSNNKLSGKVVDCVKLFGSNYACNDGACSIKTCIPKKTIECQTTETGEVKAVTNGQYGNCSTYNYTDECFKGTCKEDMGCCEDDASFLDVLVSTTCDGSTITKMWNSPCSGETYATKQDCSNEKTFNFTGGKTCTTNGTTIGCYELCTPGDIKVGCHELSDFKWYGKYVCNTGGIGYESKGEVGGCPARTSCQGEYNAVYKGIYYGVCK